MSEGLQHFYMHEAKQTWRSCSVAELSSMRETSRPRYVTWAATDFDGNQAAANYRAEFIPVDIDFADIADAIESARHFAGRLRALIGADTDSCRAYLSGSKGFHVELPASLFGDNSALEGIRLPKIARNLIEQLDVAGMDKVIYSLGKGRMWREPNVQRENQRFKVPIEWQELESLTPAGYERSVGQPRGDVTWPVVHTPNPTLVAMWAAAAVEVEAAEAARLQRIKEIEAEEPDVGELFLLRVRCALCWLAANHADEFADYLAWKRILLALHAVSMEAEARTFSQAVPGWNERDFEQQWQAIDDSASDLLSPATIIFEARQRGWRESEVVEALLPELHARLERSKADAGMLLEDDFLDQLRYLDAHHKPAHARLLEHDAFRNRKRAVLSAVRSRAAEAEPGKETPLQRAQEIIRRLGSDDLLFAGREFWRYTGSHWSPQDSDQPIRKAIHAYFGSATFSASNVSDMVHLIATETYRQGVSFDQRQGEVVAFCNGQLRLQAGEWRLHEHRRESWLTSTIPHEWSPNARCPNFLEFLRDVFRGDPDADDKRLLVLEMIGASLLPTTRFERGLILLGATGRNGKSTLLHVIEGILGGDNCAHLSIGRLADRFNIAQLRGKLANLVGEVSKGEGMPDGLVKQLVSGDLVQAEYKGRDGFSFRPYCKLWVAANFLPNQRDFSPALLRRFELVGFNRQFLPGKSQKHNLAESLAAEAEGIIVAALNAYAKAVARGNLTIPESSTKLKADWRKESDPIAEFAEDCLRLRSDADDEDAHVEAEWRLRSEEVLNAYERWAEDTRTPCKVSSKSMKQRLLMLPGVVADRWWEETGKRVRGYVGLQLEDVSMAIGMSRRWL